MTPRMLSCNNTTHKGTQNASFEQSCMFLQLTVRPMGVYPRNKRKQIKLTATRTDTKPRYFACAYSQPMSRKLAWQVF
jgi:hypothetical protein